VEKLAALRFLRGPATRSTYPASRLRVDRLQRRGGCDLPLLHLLGRGSGARTILVGWHLSKFSQWPSNARRAGRKEEGSGITETYEYVLQPCEGVL